MVAINYDPIALGYIDSLARPGANVTGLFFQHLELLAKRFGLFKEMVPSVGRVGVLSDSITADQLKVVEAANQSVGFELQPLDLQNPPYDFENAFRVAMRSRAEAVFVLESAPMFRGRTQIVQRAMENRLPTSFAFRDYVEAGGLVSYGVNFSTMYRRAAEYADQILPGGNEAARVHQAYLRKADKTVLASIRLAGGCEGSHDLIDAGFKLGDRERFPKKRKWGRILTHRLIIIDAPPLCIHRDLRPVSAAMEAGRNKARRPTHRNLRGFG